MAPQKINQKIMRRFDPDQALAGRQTERLALGVQLLEARGAMRKRRARDQCPRLIQDTEFVFSLTPIDPAVNWHLQATSLQRMLKLATK